MKSFSQVTGEQALQELQTTLQGLSQIEAKNRLAIYGANVLKKGKSVPVWQKLLRQFSDPMIILMIGAGVLALLLGSTRDMIILFSIVLINALIGFFQEYKAENIIASLQSFLSPKAEVIRDGVHIEIDAREVVPGDIVVVEEGDAVPADIRLLTTNNVATNDFSLTGESNPKSKFVHALSSLEPLQQRDNQIYLGTAVARGNAVGVVYATGMQTEIGKIAAITAQVGNDASPLQKEIGSIAKRLTGLALFLAAIVGGLSVLQHNPLQASLITALGVAASMVPEGLPAQLSVIFSLGAGRLAKQKAVIKQLYSIETLGSTTIICSDKTGTITTNEMTVEAVSYLGKEHLVSGIGYMPEGEIADQQEIPEQFFLCGVLAATGEVAPPDDEHATWYAIGDPTESALVTLALKAKIQVDQVRAQWKELKQFPFDSVRKVMSSVRQVPEGQVGAGTCLLFVKGSLRSVLERSTLSMSEQEQVIAATEQYSARSLRVLAFATRTIDAADCEGLTMEAAEQGLNFMGFVAMMDPPREGVKDAIFLARKAHVRTFIITGDQAETAKAVAEHIGLDRDQQLEIIDGRELQALSDDALQKRLRAPAIIFARTSPEDKLRIVQILRQDGNVVAVTGDGVNDAPALKQADIGVAMGMIGTDVAKEAAEIVLTDDSYVTLVTAIKEGRTIFTNLKKTLISTLTSNCGELVAILSGSLLFLFDYPVAILAVHIIMVDLVGEMFPLMALTFDPTPDGLMEEKPRNLQDHFLSLRVIADIAYVAIFMGGMGVINFLWFLQRNGYHAGTMFSDENPFYLRAMTLTFITIVFGQFANILSHRHETQSMFNKYFWTNKTLLAALVLSIGLMCIAIYTPFLQPYLRTSNLYFSDWLYGSLGFVAVLIAHEIRKWFRRRKLSKVVA